MLFYNPSEYYTSQYFNPETVLTAEEISELKLMKRFPEKFYPFNALIAAYDEENKAWSLEKIGIIYVRLLGLDPEKDYPKIKNKILHQKLNLIFDAYIKSMKDPSSPYMSNVGRGRIASELGYDSYKSWAKKHKLLKNPFTVTQRKSIKKRKNPMKLNRGNLNKWVYLNFPKYKTRDEIVSAYIRYFDLINQRLGTDRFDQIINFLNPYFELWRWVKTRSDGIKIWRQYLIDTPDMFEAMYL